MPTTTITERGQTVVPAQIRKAYHLEPASRLEWIDEGQTIRVIPVPKDPIGAAHGMFRGSKLTDALLRSRQEDNVT